MNCARVVVLISRDQLRINKGGGGGHPHYTESCGINGHQLHHVSVKIAELRQNVDLGTTGHESSVDPNS